MLAVVHNVFDIFVACRLHEAANRVRRLIQCAQGRLFSDDLRVVADRCGGRRGVLESGEVGGATDLLKLAPVLQPRLERNDVDWLAVVEEVDHGAVEHRVLRAVEVLGIDDVHHPGDSVSLHEHCPQGGLFGIQALGGDSLYYWCAHVRPSSR